MKKVIFLLLVFSFLSQLNIVQTFSQDNTSLEQFENKDSSASQNIASSSAQPNDSTITYVEGRLTSINNNSVLFIETGVGTKTVYTSTSTKYLNLDSSGKNLIGFSDLKLGDDLFVLGLVPNSTSGTADIIIRNSLSSANRSFSLIGQVSSLKDSVLDLADYSRADLAQVTIPLAPSLTFTPNSKIKKIADLKKDDRLVVVGTYDEKGSISAEIVSVFK